MVRLAPSFLVDSVKPLAWLETSRVKLATDAECAVAELVYDLRARVAIAGAEAISAASSCLKAGVGLSIRSVEVSPAR